MDKVREEFNTWWEEQPFKAQFEDVKQQMFNVWVARGEDAPSQSEAVTALIAERNRLQAQVERLERKNDNQAQTIREYSDLVMGGDVSLGMLRADLRVTSGERDQLKAEVAGLKTGYAAYEEEVKRLLEALSIAEEGLREVGENHDSTLAFLLAKRAREVIAVAKEAGQ